VVVIALAAGCGGSSDSRPAATTQAPPNTGLPVAGRAQDLVDRQNQRTAQLEQRTAYEDPAAP
jgi:hypothetical protein